tara:strand:+ start:1127 stop:1327 length:201 start_codon:yes stop_codon:yes gene_type:complete
MDEELLSQLKGVLHAHSKVIECLATINAMNVENDEYRSLGKPDPNPAEAFKDVASEISQYAEELSD